VIQLSMAYLAWLVTTVTLGGSVAKYVLDRLEPAAPVALRPGTRHAGRWIGYAERTLVYLAIVGELPWIVPVVVGLKTLVRFPEIQSASRAAPEEPGQRHDHDAPSAGTGRPSGSFVEYYLVGTLVSLASAVIVGLVARQLVGEGWASTILALFVGAAALMATQADESRP
jgi:hypothetical protein